MNQQNYKTSRSPIPMTSPSATLGLTDLPLDMILYLDDFLSFEDYKNFVRSLWPNNNESEDVRRKLWELSTHKIKTNFINGKELEIEYNFDPSRPKEDRILLNWDYLLTVFVGIERPPTFEKFVSFSKLKNFIRCHMHMDRCSNLQYASCHCYRVAANTQAREMRVRPSEAECRYKHFHHYCYRHLGYWFDFYLKNSILHQEKGEFFDEEAAKQFMHILGNTVCL